MYKEHEIIALTKDIPEHRLCAGDIGAIVAVYESGGLEVEFTTAEGDTISVVTLKTEDVRPLAKREILHVRELGKLPV